MLEDAREAVAEAHAKSYLAWIVTGGILLQVAYVAIKCLLAIVACARNKAMFNRKGVIGILCVNLVVLLGKVFFTFGKKYIRAYFVWSWAANFTSMLALMLLLRNVKPTGKVNLYVKFRGFFAVMAAVYVAVMLAAFDKRTGTLCSEGDMYPRVMAALPAMFMTNAALAWYLRRKNFFIDPDEKEETVRVDYSIFAKQVTAFFGTQRIVFVMQLTMFIIGKLADSGTTKWLGCGEEGQKWQFLNIFATIFGLCHTTTVMMQTKMCERVFHQIPKTVAKAKTS